MASNIISAIITLVQNPVLTLREFYSYKNRANSMGSALEEYIKDLFANTIDSNEENRHIRFSEVFSYLGNQNNPPDAMLKGGDAIEIKKIESPNASLALNSSYPKAKLFSNSPMITSYCKDAEVWSEKDIIYAVGIVNDTHLNALTLVYGIDYAASSHIYERIKQKIKEGVESIENVEFAQTKELGRVNRVDPLGITYMRVRGMWGIENPFTTFKYLYNRDNNKEFNFMAIINNNKYSSFSNYTDLEQEASKNTNLRIDDVLVKNPNNPSKYIKAKLITFSI